MRPSKLEHTGYLNGKRFIQSTNEGEYLAPIKQIAARDGYYVHRVW